MDKQFEITRFSRQVLLDLTQSLSEAQFNKIPAGYKNNVAWNLGHILVTQQQLVHALSGLPCEVDNDTISKFGKGSVCQTNYKLSEIETIKTQLFKVLDTTETLYKNGAFKTYKTYTTSQGFSLKTVEDAITFSNFHEGMHVGIIIALKKLI